MTSKVTTPASKLEITQQRVSFLSQTSNKDGDYADAKTPTHDLEDGALREGGAPNLWSCEYIGLVAQYAAVGLIDSILPNTIYPFLQNYLNMEGYQVLTADTLVSLPWSFKVFYGILSDCFPIFGFRRRPYMIIGWTLAFLMLILMSTMPVGQPYFTDPAYRHVAPEEYTPEIEATLNREAPKTGSKYILLMMFTAFGYLMSDVSADGVVCEIAQREPVAVRGKTQSVIYSTRTLFGILGSLITAFAFNGEKYGGQFGFSLEFTTLMLILAISMAPIIPITWFFIKEDKVATRVHFGSYMNELWEALQTRAVYQVIFYQFFLGVCNNFSYTASSPVASYWAKVEPFNEKVSRIIGDVVFISGIGIVYKWGLHWNWRYMIMGAGIIVIACDAIVTLFTIWDVVRHQWFWLGVPLAVNVPSGISFIISTFVTVELAGEGNEGAMYGLLTTVSNLSRPFSMALTKTVDAMWDFSTERIQNDSQDVRWDVTYSLLLAYGVTFVGWIFLYWLPPQKAETQELKRTGGKSKALGALTLTYVLFALTWSVATNLMGIFESTSCLVIAGGDGCDVEAAAEGE